ncbi:unnamed protein product [Cuscuta europaea]|uniref:Uncharacterized protein n=1 Tax=Cuscuta europaea TaxID=41803 RepID=A0A9P1A170_CUSEU|nr:unnamed protein product [Cuscuta europaea]
MPLLKRHATSLLEILDILIAYPLDELADLRNETAIAESLCVLIGNQFLHSGVQSNEIVNLKASFPQVVQEWRDCVQVKDADENPWSTFEKTKSLLQDLVETEEGIKTEMEELNKREKELEAQLEAIQSNRRKLNEKREALSMQTEIVCRVATVQARKVEAKEVGVGRRGNNKVELSLKSKWAATRHLFA